MTIKCPNCQQDFGRNKVALWRHVQTDDDCFLAMEDNLSLSEETKNLVHQRLRQIEKGETITTDELKRRLKSQREKREKRNRRD